MLENNTIVPNETQSMSVADIAKALRAQGRAKFSLLSPDGTKMPLPESLAWVLLIAAEALKSKNAVTLLARNSWLTTQEAADIMGYSRQVVVDLIKKNKLKASKLGTHRRIKLSDLLEFIESENKQRSKIMSRLVTHTEEAGGYDDEHYDRKRKDK